jgi:hypothetical protein
MMFSMIKNIRVQVYVLESALKQAHTHKRVLSLRDDICRLIIKFNELDKSSSQISPASLQEMKMRIKNIREQYKIKMQALKNPGPYPLVKFLPNELVGDLSSDLVPTSFEGPPKDLFEDYKDVPLRKPTIKPF